MGCGQSKINLYPRKNKNGKGNSAKKSGAADKEADEEEGTAGTAAPADDTEDDAEPGKHILPLVPHQPVIEVSASQQDFFKMLDDKIEKGKDYDSSSETEVQIENERRKNLIEKWRSASQQSSQSQPSPPTPARRRMPRPMPPERQNSPGSARRCHAYRPHVPEGMSPPPPRRASSAQSHHQDPRHINGDNWHDPTKSPVKRPQSAGANWKNNPKVAPYNQKPKKNETNDQRNYKDIELAASGQDVSQITFNPTFQTHSPAHSAKQQPYIAQILSYPMSQQVTPPSPPKYIAPPEEYQDPQNNVVEPKYNNQRQTPTAQCNTAQCNPAQSQIYYIHGNTSTTSLNQDLIQQRQQTALHLQQYVAMKQAQQQMFSYMQRGPHTVYPNIDYGQNPTRMYESEDYAAQYAHPAMRPTSAPAMGVVRPMPVPPPGYSDGSHMVQMPMWPHVPPVVATMGPWVPGQVPEMQYYPQSQHMPMYRPNSAGSAGTLTRYHKKETEGEVKNMCQSINLVRQKPIGQIVSLPGQELTVCNNVSDSPSPASVSTDSGVSPGNSALSSKNSVFSTPSSSAASDSFSVVDNKTKKSKSHPTMRSLKNSKSLDS